MRYHRAVAGAVSGAAGRGFTMERIHMEMNLLSWSPVALIRRFGPASMGRGRFARANLCALIMHPLRYRRPGERLLYLPFGTTHCGDDDLLQRPYWHRD
jgi:hypothetical protein